MSNSMDKLNMKTKDITDENIDFIESKFPNVITETFDKNGVLKKKVDFIALKQELSNDIVDETKEEYVLTWPGKRNARILANKGIDKTLRPCKEESLNFNETKNIYIEGDNIDVLKLLRETYLGKIKMIYIDPPYNREKDTIYMDKDKFSQSEKEYLQETGQINEEGYKMFQNTETNGRFHSDWLSSIYPALRLAFDLLSDDGVIFVSIDENEQSNLQKLLDEIFGHRNFISNCFVLDNLKGKTNDNFITSVGSRLFIYAKNLSVLSDQGFNDIENPFGDTIENKYKEEDELGFYNTITFKKTGQSRYREDRPYMFYPILQKGGRLYSITTEEFKKIYDNRTKQFNDQYVDSLKKKYNDYEFILPTDSDGKFLRWTSGFQTYQLKMNGDIFYSGGIKQKVRPEANEMLQYYASGTPKSLFYKTSYSLGTEDFKDLFGECFFDYPKPVSLIVDILKLLKEDKDEYCLDFYSGSATTAQAVMQLNAEDGGHRKFIMVQIREEVSESRSPAAVKFLDSIGKPHYITEIGKERIRRAGQKILNENPSLKGKLDVGFRDFKLDESNMKKVYYSPEDYTQDLLASVEDNINEDRTPLDLVFQVMLELGIALDSKIEEQIIRNKKVYVIKENTADEEPALICCFDPNVTEEVVVDIAKLKPLRVVFRDSSMKNDNVYINFDQIFETYSPGTKRRVL